MGLPLDYAVIFDRGGRVHWSRALGKVRGDPVSALISNVLLEEKGGVDQSATIDSYACHWRPVNEADALIVVVSQKSLALDFVPELLESMKAAFSAQFKGVFLASAYDATFTSIEAALDGKLRLRAKAAMRAAPVEKAKAAAPKAAPAAVADDDDGPAESVEESVEDKLKKRGALAKGRKVPGKASSAPLPKAAAEAGKKKTVWADSTKKLSAKEAACLDRSADKDVDPDEARSAAEMKARMPERGEAAAWDVEDELAIDDDEDDDYVVETIEDASSKKSWFAKGVGLMGSITGETILTAEQIAPIMDTLRQRLEEKNVAVEIAADICASVTSSIVGKKVARFGRAKTLIRDALKDAVARVLTPRKSTDVLREVLAAKGRRKGPYSIVFVGINGVGKSTTLSKVAYYLKEHGVDVQITACDTFRSGAVEQLRSHARCLDVELYEKGYLKDPSDVAKSSLDHAKAQKRDCVLIDTAGRMQNNDKLMRELAKLVTVNDPDLILFVGEALVGNDGIDQLNMFNSALQSFCGNGRCIDGLVLTKFDTIDDKVGATLSMTYKTGQPIMFIGVGQKYTHLKKLSVNAVVNALFS
ncbi:SRP54-type protein [Pelagophyceae sp. CCMP2097]|nr:SRP54-type protein [Pelagophyceae sp. CCMP2097]